MRKTSHLGVWVEVGHHGGPVNGVEDLVLPGHPPGGVGQLAGVHLRGDHGRPAHEGSLGGVGRCLHDVPVGPPGLERGLQHGVCRDVPLPG